MFSHIMIGTNDLDRSKAFYDALLATLDVKPATTHHDTSRYRSTLHTVYRIIGGGPAVTR